MYFHSLIQFYNKNLSFKLDQPSNPNLNCMLIAAFNISHEGYNFQHHNWMAVFFQHADINVKPVFKVEGGCFIISLHTVCLAKIRYGKINFIVLAGKFILAVVARAVSG